jgi:hypothetical protein
MLRKFVLITLATALLVPASSFAESLHWKFRSYHKNAVELSFYSQNRNLEWPGNGRVHVLRDYDVHNYSLNCVKGEKICYGAWVQGASSSYWGGGQGGKQACSSCCYTCNGGQTPVINLNAR